MMTECVAEVTAITVNQEAENVSSQAVASGDFLFPVRPHLLQAQELPKIEQLFKT